MLTCPGTRRREARNLGILRNRADSAFAFGLLNQSRLTRPRPRGASWIQKPITRQVIAAVVQVPTAGPGRRRAGPGRRRAGPVRSWV